MRQDDWKAAVCNINIIAGTAIEKCALISNYPRYARACYSMLMVDNGKEYSSDFALLSPFLIFH